MSRRRLARPSEGRGVYDQSLVISAVEDRQRPARMQPDDQGGEATTIRMGIRCRGMA